MSPPNKMMPKTVFAPWLGLGIGLIVLAGTIGLNLYLEHGNRAMREKDRLSSQVRVIARNMESHLASTNRALEGIRDDLPNWKGVSGFQDEMRYLKALTNATPETLISFVSALIAFAATIAIFLPMARRGSLNGTHLLIGGLFYVVFLGLVVARLAGLV